MKYNFNFGHTGFSSLSSTIHFYTAALEEWPILVFSGGQLIGGGKIENITEDSIQIKGEKYLLTANTFTYTK